MVFCCSYCFCVLFFVVWFDYQQIVFDVLVLEFGDVDFWVLQVVEQGDMVVVFGSQFMDQGGTCFVVVWCVVGEVQMGYVEIGNDQLFQYFW